MVRPGENLARGGGEEFDVEEVGVKGGGVESIAGGGNGDGGATAGHDCLAEVEIEVARGGGGLKF